MSDYKIRFHNPHSGQQVEVGATEKIAPGSRGRVEGHYDQSVQDTDGTVDVLIREDGWFSDSYHHLGVDTSTLTPDEVTALKSALSDPGDARVSVLNLRLGMELEHPAVLKTDAQGELTGVSQPLGPESQREVRLTPAGYVATPEGLEPQTLAEIGDGFFRIASLIDDSKHNFFDKTEASLPLKQKMFHNLTEAAQQVEPAAQLPAGMEPQNALQLRSSTATTLLELLNSQEHTTEGFKQEVFDAYAGMLQRETNPLLKDSMIFQLRRISESLPADLQTRVTSLSQAVAPTHPPYDQWFANGDDTVKVAFVAGDGESFERTMGQLKRSGFEVLSESHNTATLERVIEHDGVETRFLMEVRTNRGNMYEEIAEDDVDIIAYSGHSDWGRNVRRSLESAPEASGEGKLLFTDLCAGKGEIQMTRDTFPKAHLITTHNSSYYNQTMHEDEGVSALCQLFEGVAKRAGYEEIAENVRKGDQWGYIHRGNDVDNNFIFPTDLETRSRILDQDHDGQADVFDRMVNFNTFDVETDTAREFSPITPSRDADVLVGTKVHFAAQTINRMALFSGILQHSNGHGEVVPDGYFEPAEGENALFRFEQVEGLDKPTLKMSMNVDFAHMSEEALRMAASYEYAMYKAEQGEISLDPKDAKLNALTFASHSLYTDAGYRDNVVWDEFLKAYQFPAIERHTVEAHKEADGHSYAGSRQAVKALWNALPADIQNALLDPTVGQPAPL